ncbi:hypothetical protein F2Q69_00058712 [Brassica cretica]|uniref:Uncharacterized protein n=1 Tax=Brassica cretica TaxID=69181 RepID=A0A8S9RBM5_BRACR|nr:hypothetical protein F2Q69_00058712 [Brassica cretica]
MANSSIFLSDLKFEVRILGSQEHQTLWQADGNGYAPTECRVQSGGRSRTAPTVPKRVMVTLRIEMHSSEAKIVPFTSINPKYVRGRLFLNAASGTNI